MKIIESNFWVLLPFRFFRSVEVFGFRLSDSIFKGFKCKFRFLFPFLWLVGNGRMVVIVVTIVPHSSIPD